MGCNTRNNQSGQSGLENNANNEYLKKADNQKRWAETMSDPQVQQAYMTVQMAGAFEVVASGHDKTASENAAKTTELHHVQPLQSQPVEQPSLRATIQMEAPVYSSVTARQQTLEEVASYADPSHGSSEGSSHSKLDQAGEKLQNNLDKWAGKTEHLTNKLQKVEMKSQAHADKDIKNFHSFTFYSDENGRLSVSHNVERMTKSRHEASKGRGILHKLDARFSNENVGFVYLGKSQTGKGLELRSADIPEPLRKARHFAFKGALATETAALNTMDNFKRGVVDPAANLALNKARNELYRAGQENAGLKAATMTAGTAYSAAMGLKRWGASRKEYLQQSKGIKFENKQVRLKNKIEKLELKSAAAKETALTKALIAGAKEGGLDVKFSRAEKKKAWRQVYNGSKGDGYLRSGKNIRKEEKWTNKHSDAKPLEKNPATKLDKRINKLDKTEFKNAKKVYKTKTVKKEYVNDLTGKKGIKHERVVDTSRKKRPKLKKPPSLMGMAVAGGAKKLGRKAMSEMATDDNTAISATGKGLQFLASELPKNHRRSAQQSKLKFEKKQAKAELKMESARSEKLILEKERANGKTKPPSKKEKKQARKKASQKKHNAQAFKERAKKAAKKVQEKAASAAKEFFFSKAKFIGIAALIGVMILIMPMLLLSLLGGGGGGAGADGTIVGMATYTEDREGLMEFNAAYNKLMWEWQKNINDKMTSLKAKDTKEWEWVLNPCSGGSISTCKHIEGHSYTPDTNNVYKVIKTLYGGEKCNFSQYDITCLYAYFTVKYRDNDWASVSDEMGNFFNDNFELVSKDKDKLIDIEETKTLDYHITMECKEVKNPPATDPQGKPVNTGYHYEHSGRADPHNVDVTKKITYYYLYKKKNGYNTVEEYIRDKIKQIGESGGDDDEVNDYGIKVNEDGKTDGELHYEFLLESLGLHQVIDFPVLDENGDQIDWSKINSNADGRIYGKLTELYNKNEGTGHPKDMAYRQKEEDINYVNIPYSGERLECVAGGSGVIKSKTSNSVTVEYTKEKLLVTYTCTSTDVFGNVHDGNTKGMTTLSVGSTVEKGTHLFYGDATDGNNPSVKIVAHDTELDADINPLLVIQSKIH